MCVSWIYLPMAIFIHRTDLMRHLTCIRLNMTRYAVVIHGLDIYDI